MGVEDPITVHVASESHLDYLLTCTVPIVETTNLCLKEGRRLSVIEDSRHRMFLLLVVDRAKDSKVVKDSKVAKESSVVVIDSSEVVLGGRLSTCTLSYGLHLLPLAGWTESSTGVRQGRWCRSLRKRMEKKEGTCVGSSRRMKVLERNGSRNRNRRTNSLPSLDSSTGEETTSVPGSVVPSIRGRERRVNRK